MKKGFFVTMVLCGFFLTNSSQASFGKIESALGDALEGVEEVIVNIADHLQSIFSEVGGSIKPSVGKSLQNTSTSFFDDVEDVFEGTVTGVVEYFHSLFGGEDDIVSLLPEYKTVAPVIVEDYASDVFGRNPGDKNYGYFDTDKDIEALRSSLGISPEGIREGMSLTPAQIYVSKDLFGRDPGDRNYGVLASNQAVAEALQ